MSRVIVSEPLVSIRTGGTRRPWFCVHPVGGHLREYFGLADALPADQPMWGLRSRGVRDARAEHRRLAELAADYATVIEGVHAEPYRLFGWSMGGTVAHAIACELERRGRVVEWVGLVDAPIEVVIADDTLEIAVRMAIMVFHPAPPPRAELRRALRGLEAVPGGSYAAWCVAHGLLPPEGVPHDEFDATVALLPLHHAMLAGHRPGVARAPLRVWRPRELAGASRLEWSAHTTGTCETTVVGGDHFTIMRPPHVAAIAADLVALG